MYYMWRGMCDEAGSPGSHPTTISNQSLVVAIGRLKPQYSTAVEFNTCSIK
jgi:hypothetical protein